MKKYSIILPVTLLICASVTHAKDTANDENIRKEVAAALNRMASYTRTKTLNALQNYSESATVLVNDIDAQTVSVVSYNIEAYGCDYRTKPMKIESIKLDDSDIYPDEMLLSTASGQRVSMPTNFNELEKVTQSWMSNLFQIGDNVNVQFTVCGSGGFPQITSISKHVNEFPQAGIDVDNPNKIKIKRMKTLLDD